MSEINKASKAKLLELAKAACLKLKERHGAGYKTEDAVLYAQSQAGHENSSTTMKSYVDMAQLLEIQEDGKPIVESSNHALKAQMRRLERENAELKSQLETENII
jgi:hypothetical protein